MSINIIAHAHGLGDRQTDQMILRLLHHLSPVTYHHALWVQLEHITVVSTVYLMIII